MQESPVPREGQLDDLDFGIFAIATVKASLAFTLECLSRTSMNAHELRSAIEDALSLASRRELEVRVLRHIQTVELATDNCSARPQAVAASYETLKKF